MKADILHPNDAGQVAEAKQLAALIGTPALQLPSVLYNNLPVDLTSWSNIGGDALAIVGGQTDPLGGSTAYRLTGDGSAANRYIRTAFNPGSAANNAQTFTLDAKAGTLSWLHFFDGWNNKDTWVNLATGAVGTQNHVVSVWSRGNGWYRLRFTFAVAAAAGYINLATASADQDGYYNNDNGNLFLWKPQATSSR